MTQATPETILGIWMDRAWNQLDASVIDELMAPDALVHGLGDAPLQGREAWRAFHAAFLAAFSSIRIVQDEQLVSGNLVAVRFTSHLVHRATGTPVTVKGMTMGRVENGLMVEGWNFVDFLPLLTALGMLPERALERALGG